MKRFLLLCMYCAPLVSMQLFEKIQETFSKEITNEYMNSNNEWQSTSAQLLASYKDKLPEYATIINEQFFCVALCVEPDSKKREDIRLHLCNGIQLGYVKQHAVVREFQKLLANHYKQSWFSPSNNEKKRWSLDDIYTAYNLCAPEECTNDRKQMASVVSSLGKPKINKGPNRVHNMTK